MVLYFVLPDFICTLYISVRLPFSLSLCGCILRPLALTIFNSFAALWLRLQVMDGPSSRLKFFLD